MRAELETKETPPSADYQGAFAQLVSRRVGHELGDPAKAAQSIIAIAGEEPPPLRLLLARDAVHLARQIDRADLAEIARWERLSTSTDFAGLTNPA